MTIAWESRSLLRRILVSLTLANLATIAITVLWFLVKFESTSQDMHDSTLTSRAEEIADSLSLSETGQVVLSLPKSMRRGFDGPGGRHRFSVRDEGGAVLLASTIATGTPPAHIEEGEYGTIYRYHDDGGTTPHMAGVARRVDLHGRHLVVQVEESDIRHGAIIRALLEKTFEEGGGLMLPLLFLPLGISILVVRRSFRPVAVLSQLAETITPKTTGIRLPESEVPAEIEPLVHAINSAFDRLAEGLRIQRDFTAGAAHELRTPLAILGAHLDSLSDDPAKAALRGDIDDMAHIIDQLLRVAQIEALTECNEGEADLGAIAAEVVAYLAPLAIRQGKSIALEQDDHAIVIHGKPQPIFHAVSNLVSNALRHTPPGTVVTVTLAQGPSGPSIAVRDHGPGVAAEHRLKVFERFWRADRSTSGSGLGIHIVKLVMDMHGGTVGIADAKAGGALFTLNFPGPELSRA